MVTFLMMPGEIGWAATVYWAAGDVACRFYKFGSIFGLFLSSNITWHRTLFAEPI